MSHSKTPLRQLPDFDLTAALSSAPTAIWRDVPPLTLGQPWNAEPEPGFRAATVRLATTNDRFVILAELPDDEIITEAKQHNDPLWDQGDVFEIFLQHAGRPEYYEFHIAPNGVTLDLRYPFAGAPRTKGVEQYMLDEPHFSAQVIAEPEQSRWRVAVEIPVAKLAPAEFLNVPSEWLFSFSRYDCARDREPILSTTSSHQALNFHQTEDWKHFSVPAFT